jgi:hypothetical protein
MTTNLDHLRAEIELLRWAEARKAEINDIEKKARATVEEALGEDESGTLDGDLAVTWKHGKQNRLNQKLLAQLYPKVLEECKTVVPTRTFKVFA